MSGNEYVAELRAEVERLRATVARVEGLAAEWEPWLAGAARQLRDALSASSPSVEHRYTQTDGQAPAGRYEGAQGAGDGV